jgi:predicted DNA-binding mobile mystery protein A
MKAEVRKRARLALDNRLAELKPAERFKAPPRGWIRALRDALGMSSAQLGKRLGKVSQSVDDWEKAEANGSIQLKTLRQAAEALGCSLAYALVPKTSLDEFRHSRARKIAIHDLKRVAHTMKLEAQGIDDVDLETRIEAYIRDKLRDRDIWNEP